MSDLLMDLCIWTFLVVAVGFGGIGLMGLLIFPDTRSRMFTAFRATMIGVGALVLSLIFVNLSVFRSTGENPYGTFIMHAVFLLFVLLAGNWVMYRMIRDLTKRETACQLPDPEPGSGKKE
jgi:multisubunit Na+/H+ antiporter MnhG subunit